jgi:hypothetical protein
MTLCMAAICWDVENDTEMIICGSDKRAEVSWAGGNVALKFAWAKPGWAALFAGEVSKAQDFLSTCRSVLDYESGDPLTRDDLFDKFNQASIAHKEKLCRRFIPQQLGIDFDRFFTHGEDELPSDIRARIFHEMAQLEFGCELLIFGFTKRVNVFGVQVVESQIIEIDRYGEVSLHQNFGSIGTGSVIAKSTLYQREQTHIRSPEQTMYHLYEAAKLAAGTAPGVGEIDTFLIIKPSEDETEVVRIALSTHKSREIMEKTFQEVGPKPLGYVEPLDIENFNWLIPGKTKPEQSEPPSDAQTSEDQP